MVVLALYSCYGCDIIEGMFVFIDGENFRQRLADVLEKEGLIQHGQYFNYDLRGLLVDLLGDNNLNIRYYSSEIRMPVGYVPSEDVRKRIEFIRNNTRRWVARLKNQDVEYVKAGNLKVKSGKQCRKCGAIQDQLQEKGVDVRLALDILEFSMSEDVKEIAVVSSDTDICPAYHKIEKYGVKVKYICFASALNRAVSAATNETITITGQKAKEYLLES